MAGGRPRPHQASCCGMKRRFLFLTAVLLACGAFLWIAATDDAPPRAPLEPLPYAEAGLTEREAAAHLLNRFTYGARPGDVDRVVEMGLETWLDRQLNADFLDKSLKKKLAPFKVAGALVSERQRPISRWARAMNPRRVPALSAPPFNFNNDTGKAK